MGTPFKLMIRNTPVFLCCDGCEEEAKAHETQTLLKAQSLKDQKAKKTVEKK
jgi:hypothetical protein